MMEVLKYVRELSKERCWDRHKKKRKEKLGHIIVFVRDYQ
jgi:hypothetical protein